MPVIDPLEEARAIELDERLASGERGGSSPAELLRAATESGHACLGWPSAGRIEAGALADLVTYRLDSQRLAGISVEHAIPSLVFSGTAADVTNVVVGGRDVVRGGAHTQLDVAGELDGAMRAVWR